MRMGKGNLFKLLSLAGMALGAIGTLLSNWADDKELDMVIDEKINEKLTAHKDDEESEES